MKIYLNELYKLFSKRMFLFLFVLLFVANILLFAFLQNSSEEKSAEYFDRKLYQQMLDRYDTMTNDEVLTDVNAKIKEYKLCNEISNLMYDSGLSAEELSGTLSEYEKSDKNIYKAAMEILNSGEDYTTSIAVYKRIENQYEYFQKYDIFLNEMDERAEKQATFSIFADKDDFSYNNIEKTPTDFEGLKGIELKAADYTGIESGTQYRYTDLFVVIVIFLMCVYIFSQEREKSLLLLVKSTKSGHLATAVSKILTLFTYIILTCVLFYSSDIIVSGLIYGIGNLSSPVQSIQSFMNCSLNITVLQYLVLWLLSKILTVITTGAVFAGIFLLFKNSAWIYIVCASAIVLEFVLYVFIPKQSPINHFRYINVMYFFDGKELLGDYLNLNFFTKPINIIPIYIIFCLGVITVFCGLTLFAFCKQKQIASRNVFSILTERIKGRFSRIRGSVSIFRSEMFKLLICEKGLIILIFAVFICVYLAVSIKYSNSYYSIPDAVYHSYLATLEGKSNTEKEEYINSQQKYFDSIIQEQEELLSLENPTDEQKNRISNIQTILDGKYLGFEKLLDKYEYLQEQKKQYGTEIYFIDETKYGNLFTDKNKDWQEFMLCVIILIIALGNVFAYEHKKNMSKLIRSAPNGKHRLALTKYLSALIVFAVIFISCYLPKLVAFYRQYGMIIGEAPVQSVRVFENAPQGMTLSGLLIFMYAMRLFLLLSTAIIIVSLSELLESYFLTMTVSTAVFVFGGILLYNSDSMRIFALTGEGKIGLVITITVLFIICAAVIMFLAICKHIGISVHTLIKNRLPDRKEMHPNGTQN